MRAWRRWHPERNRVHRRQAQRLRIPQRPRRVAQWAVFLHQRPRVARGSSPSARPQERRRQRSSSAPCPAASLLHV